MRRLLLLLVIPLLIGTAVGVANWRVDPFGWFYDGGALTAATSGPTTGCLIGDDAIGGVSYLRFKEDVLRHRPATTTVVVGSSRVLKIGPRPGEQTFTNLGMPGISPGSLRTLFGGVARIEPGRRLTVYLSVDFMWLNPTWSFAEEFQPRLTRRLGYVLSRSALEESWRIVRRHAGLGAALRGYERETFGGSCVLGRGTPGIAWRPDGVRMYAFELDPAAQRPRPQPSTWQGTFAGFRAGQYDGYTRIDRDALRRLADALDLARRKGWRVVGFAPPDSTFYAHLFATRPETAAAWREFTAAVPALFRNRGFGWLDLSDIRFVPCAGNQFVDDGWHVNAACARRIRARLDAAAAGLSPAGAR